MALTKLCLHQVAIKPLLNVPLNMYTVRAICHVSKSISLLSKSKDFNTLTGNKQTYRYTNLHPNYFTKRCPEKSTRYFSTFEIKQNFDATNLLETWTYQVHPRGSLTVDLPFDTIVRPLPPQDYPDMDKVILGLYYDSSVSGTTPDAYKLAEISDIYDLNVNFDTDKANMNINCGSLYGMSLPIICYLQVPLQAELNIRMTDKGNITVERMESNSIDISTELGNCYFKSIKCLYANVFCKSGSIKSKSTFLGNIGFQTAECGSIEADKLQGSSILCVTEQGKINIKSLYSEETSLKTQSGNISLGNIHGNLGMEADNSNIKIESLEGDLNSSLQSGSFDVHLSKHKTADINLKKGDVNLSFTENVNTDLNLNCQDVNIDEKFDHTISNNGQGYIGQSGKSQTNVNSSSGKVNINMLDWIQTTKLAILMKREKHE